MTKIVIVSVLLSFGLNAIRSCLISRIINIITDYESQRKCCSVLLNSMHRIFSICSPTLDVEFFERTVNKMTHGGCISGCWASSCCDADAVGGFRWTCCHDVCHLLPCSSWVLPSTSYPQSARVSSIESLCWERDEDETTAVV